MTVSQGSVRRFRELVDGGRSFVLTGHVNIDGDSLGSMLGMYHFLTRRGKTVRAICFEPLLDRYRFLGGDGVVEVFDPARHAAAVAEADGFMMFDFSATTRIPGLWELAKDSRAVKVCVDHHPADELPGDIHLHDPRAPATGTIVLDLIRGLGGTIDREIAEPLLVAIGTDTGWFRYHNTSSAVLADVASLLGNGIDASRVYREVYQRNDLSLIHLIGRVAATAREELAGRLLWADIPLALAQELGVGPYETDELLDLLRTSRSAELVALFRELPRGEVRVNLRSRGAVDVGELAKHLGGGGHAYAAGVTLSGGLAASRERALAKLREALAPPAVARR